MNISKVLGILLLIVSINSVQANNFKDRFQVVRKENGELDHIRSKMTMRKLAVDKYFNKMKKDLLQLKTDIVRSMQKVTKKKEKISNTNQLLALGDFSGGKDKIGDFAEKLASYIEIGKLGTAEGMNHSFKAYLENAYRNLSQINIKTAFEKIKEKGILKKLLSTLKIAYQQQRYDIVAMPNNKKFFYSQKVTNNVSSIVINFAKNRLKDVPLLNFLSFMINDVVIKLRDQREISQNMLLYYLINHENSLGLSAEEIDKVISSIYESRIDVLGYNESKKAANNWLDYGWNKFDFNNKSAVNKAKEILRGKSNIKSPRRLDYVFYEGSENGENVIYNLSLSKHMLDASPAPVLYKSSPKYIRTLRTFVKLGQFALSFVPKVPTIILNGINSFANSWYKEQEKMDSYLYSYLLEENREDYLGIVENQIDNPFVQLSI